MPRTFGLRADKDSSARKPFAFAAAALIAACWAVLGFAPFSSQVARSQSERAAPRTLSMGERVMYQRAVDEVYWRHTAWPKENADPKPSLDEVVTIEQTTARVEDTLRKSEALARRWGRPVAPEQLQAEAERQARETRSPEVLRELWQALGNDPYVIAEVLARPALVDRLARTSFSSEATKGASASASFDSWWTGASDEFTGEAAPASDFNYQLAEINQAGAGADDTWKPTQALPVGTGTAVWTGTEVIVWGGATSAGGRTDLGARYNPATDTWTSTSTVNAPMARAGHTALWTGTEMLVWGGSIGSGTTNTGGRYNPQTDTWTPTSIVNAPFRSGHVAVWTGAKMIIWGISSGAASVYDLSTDSWKEASRTNAPGTNVGHRAVWTGTEMFIWGGINTVTGRRGGLYNPATDTWRAPNQFNAPSDRTGFTMVWTGTEAIVWGGYEGNTITLNTGGRYNPQTDTWTPTSTANAALSRYGHTAVWTGTEMVVYGGDSRPTGSPDKLTNTGGRYNPQTDTWTLTSTAGAPLKNNHVAVWTGTEMFVWGGRHVSQTVFREAARYKPSTDSWIPTNNNNSALPSNALGVWSGAELLVWGRDPNCISACYGVGGRYDLATNLWRPMNVTGAPAGDAAAGATAVWTGKEMIVAGGRYNPQTDTWARMSTVGAPVNFNSPAVWTGTELLVWGGGATPENNPAPAGGRYNPATDSWRLMSTDGAPTARDMHSVVWTGTEMVVWGGSGYFSGSQVNTGGRYNPQTDTWRPTSTVGAPEARLYNTAVWTGAEMIVWGGWVYSNEGSRYLNTGGRYNPASDSWQPTSLTGVPAARSHHRAVWTGSTMIVWGGRVPVTWTSTGDPVYTGARYNPTSDIWTATSLQSAPSRRDSHVQVWTGTEMIVWGGTGPSGAPTQDGAVYNAPGSSQGNTPPSVRLTNPAEGAPFVAGDNVQLDAEASDADGAVSSVSFYANNTLLGTDNAAPFTLTWNRVRSGGYALTAAATDNAGGVTRSAPVNINVEPLIGPPNAVITSPTDGATFEAPATIRVTADVQPNPDRDVTKVEFYLSDGQGPQTRVYTDNDAPYGFDLTNRPDGNYVIYAYAYDSEDVGISPGARFTVTAGPARPFNLSGQVTDDRGVPIVGIPVKLTGTDTATATTNTYGYYFFGSLMQGGNYTVTPAAPNYTYAPSSLTFNNLGATQSSANFLATQAGYGIVGRLTFADGNPIYPATVNLSGSKTATTAVSSDGTYFFSNLAPGGTYTVQPYKNQYTFEPNFRTFENLSAEQTADFTGTPQGTTYSVAGRIVNEAGAPVAGLRVRLNTTRVTSTQYRTTDADGRYSFGVVSAGENLMVWPEDFTYHYRFVPDNRTYIALAQNVSDANFVATTRSYVISGRLTDQNGKAIPQATVNLLDSASASTSTDVEGNYSFKTVAGGGTYTVQPSKDQYTFEPASRTFSALGSDQTADLRGVQGPPPATRLNHALSSNGGVASASSYFSDPYWGTFAPRHVNDGARRAAAGQLWLDKTQAAWPDWVEVAFPVAKTITEVVVVTQQDDPAAEPTEQTLFTKYGVTAFEVQYWTGTQWQTVPGGAVVGNDRVIRRFSFPAVTTTKLRVVVAAGADNTYSRLVEVEAWGDGSSAPPPPPARVNHALSANGGVASASSYFSNPAYGTFLPQHVNDGARQAASGALWLDNTLSAWPDWVEVSFNGAKTIDEVNVFTQQDDPANEPTEQTVFTKYGVTAFEVQYWTGTQWQAVPGGIITGNDRVWRKLTFPAVSTTKVRVVVTAGKDNAYSRLVEVEAWGGPAAPPPPPATKVNHALSSNGGAASASSSFASPAYGSYPASAVNDGSRRGASPGSLWLDSTLAAWPDWVEVAFNTTKSITEVVVVTQQDDASAEPADEATFTKYGVTGFEVQYWTGAAWQAVPGGSVTNNDRVIRRLSFPAVTTTKVRVVVSAGRDNTYSRIVEVEAY